MKKSMKGKAMKPGYKAATKKAMPKKTKMDKSKKAMPKKGMKK